MPEIFCHVQGSISGPHDQKCTIYVERSGIQNLFLFS